MSTLPGIELTHKPKSPRVGPSGMRVLAALDHAETGLTRRQLKVTCGTLNRLAWLDYVTSEARMCDCGRVIGAMWYITDVGQERICPRKEKSK
jgi:hypothetical protein